MKNIIIISTLTLLLSACTWGQDTPWAEANKPNPYPTTSISWEIGANTTPAVWENYSAKGTEPFWSAEITASETTVSRPGETDVIVKKYETRQDDKWAIISIKDAKGEFFVTLTKGECSDGMSDTKYKYNATVLVGAETLKGCAMKK